MKEELDRNANFVLLVISEKLKCKEFLRMRDFAIVLFSKTNSSFSQRNSNVIMYDLLSMIFCERYKGSSYAGVDLEGRDKIKCKFWGSTNFLYEI